MTEGIRIWVLSVTCTAALVALAESLAPKGSVKKLLKLVGGLVLMLCVVRPVLKLDTGDLGEILTRYRVESSTREMDVGEENMRLIKAIIEEETGAYILDKARSLGIRCEVRVTAQAREGEELPVPCQVWILGTLDEKEREALTRLIEAELAIPAEQQTYEGKESEG